MRKWLVTILTLSMPVALSPVCALEASDTMTSWKHASAKERAELLDRLLGKQSRRSAGVRECLDAASNVPAHTELKIGDLVKACNAPDNAGQPV